MVGSGSRKSGGHRHRGPAVGEIRLGRHREGGAARQPRGLGMRRWPWAAAAWTLLLGSSWSVTRLCSRPSSAPSSPARLRCCTPRADLASLTAEHLGLVVVSSVLAALTGVGLGVVVTPASGGFCSAAGRQTGGPGPDLSTGGGAGADHPLAGFRIRTHRARAVALRHASGAQGHLTGLAQVSPAVLDSGPGPGVRTFGSVPPRRGPAGAAVPVVGTPVVGGGQRRHCGTGSHRRGRGPRRPHRFGSGDPELRLSARRRHRIGPVGTDGRRVVRRRSPSPASSRGRPTSRRPRRASARAAHESITTRHPSRNALSSAALTAAVSAG